MKIRDRVKELRRMRAGDLAPNPKNWRTHPKAQKDALRGILAEVGIADALLARELPDGRLMLIDGHLRADTTPDQVVPVLVLDVNEAEADKLLLTIDPLSAMAESSREKLDELLDEAGHSANEALNGLFAALGDRKKKSKGEGAGAAPVADRFEVIVECDDEPAQAELFERLTQEGRRCRVLTF